MHKPETIPRARGRLEELVREVCDSIADGTIENPDDKPWTPHRLAAIITERYPGSGSPPSTGAISDTLHRWEEVGFAVVNDSPLAFEDFTDAGRDEGLTALKAQHRAARAARKAADAAALAESEAAAAAAAPPIDLDVQSSSSGSNVEFSAEELDDEPDMFAELAER